jgi:predicted nucleic acid-binding protein
MVEAIKGDPKALAILSNLDGRLFTSQLGRLEVLRTFNRFYSSWIPHAYDFLNSMNLINLDNYILDAVENYNSEITLTTADAIHVSSAQSLLDDADYLVTFDKEMAKNAKKMGLQVISS